MSFANATMIPLSTGAGDCMESMNASSSRAEGQALIASFADVVTEALFHGATNREIRRLPPNILTVAVRKLDMLAAARSLDDLRSPPGNRLEALQGDLRGLFSIRINDQWRILFRWAEGDAHDVRIVDYHR